MLYSIEKWNGAVWISTGDCSLNPELLALKADRIATKTGGRYRVVGIYWEN